MDRLNFSLFLWLQHQRTPLGRQWQVFAQEKVGTLAAMKELLNAERVHHSLKEDSRFKSPEEIEAWRQQTIADLDEGRLMVGPSHDGEVTGMFLTAEAGTNIVATQMSWVGLQASGSGFILSDHPLALVDGHAQPQDSVAWLSSQTVEATMPLDPWFCLLLTPGPPYYRVERADANRVLDINLRTYASAQRCIYGPSASAVQHVQASARANRKQVMSYEPRSPAITIFERYEGEREPFKTTVHRAPSKVTRSARRR